MEGLITDFDKKKKSGKILGNDGKIYDFTIDGLIFPLKDDIQKGVKVEFNIMENRKKIVNIAVNVIKQRLDDEKNYN